MKYVNLIKTLREIQDHIPVNMTSNEDTVAPYFSNAERLYIQQLIGKAQFDALSEAYKTAEYHLEAIGDEEIRRAIFICQKVISNLGYYLAMPVLAVSVGVSGIQVLSNEQTKQAFQWQVEDLKDSILELGFSAIEELLAFLVESPDKFPEYIASEEFAQQESVLIRTASEFSKYYNIGNSRFVLHSINYLQKRVEDQLITPLISRHLLEALKEDGLSAEMKDLANNYVKPGLALMTIAKAMVERVIILENGRAQINFKGTYANMKETAIPSQQQLRETVDQLTADANNYLQSGKEYISANLKAFPAFVPPPVRRRFKVNNDKTKGIFGV